MFGLKSIKLSIVALAFTVASFCTLNLYAATPSKPHQILAELTSKTESEILSTWQSGKSLKEIADEAGVYETFKTRILDNINLKLDKAVQEGKLTQAQKDAKLEKITVNIDKYLSKQYVEHKIPKEWLRNKKITDILEHP